MQCEGLRISPLPAGRRHIGWRVLVHSHERLSRSCSRISQSGSGSVVGIKKNFEVAVGEATKPQGHLAAFTVLLISSRDDLNFEGFFDAQKASASRPNCRAIGRMLSRKWRHDTNLYRLWKRLLVRQPARQTRVACKYCMYSYIHTSRARVSVQVPRPTHGLLESSRP